MEKRVGRFSFILRSLSKLVFVAYFALLACSAGDDSAAGGSSSAGGATMASSGPPSTAPVISSISPTSYSIGGGGLLTINGSNLSAVVTAQLGSNNCSSIAVISDTQIVCTLPQVSTPGIYSVSVINNLSQSVTLNSSFTYNTFLYVSNQSSGLALGSISAYRVDNVSGFLNPVTGSPFSTGKFPYGIAASKNNKFMFAANYQGSSISAFTINGLDGSLIPVAGSPFSTTDQSSPDAVVVSNDNQFLYVCYWTAGSKITKYAINSVTGAISSPVSVATGFDLCGSMAIDPSGKFLYAGMNTSSRIVAYSISALTGDLTVIGNYPTGGTSKPDGLAIDPSGKFLFTGNNSTNDVSAFLIDASTGVLTSVLGSPFPQGNTGSGAGVAVTPNGNFVISNSQGSKYVSSFSLDNATGVLSSRLDFMIEAASPAPNSVIIDNSGQYIYTVNTGGNSLSRFTFNSVMGSMFYQESYNTGPQPGIAVILK